MGKWCVKFLGLRQLAAALGFAACCTFTASKLAMRKRQQAAAVQGVRSLQLLDDLQHLADASAGSVKLLHLGGHSTEQLEINRICQWPAFEFLCG